jgi:hypothetical protein
MKMTGRLALALLIILAVLPATPVAAQPIPRDVVTVGIVSGSGVIDVPVYIRDVSNTTLGMDQPAGARIQSYSITVHYAPTAPVQSISFTRAGITAGLTPTFESNPSVPGTVTLLDTFPEATQPIPFTLDALPPGNLIGHLTVAIAPGTPAGTVINLTLDAALTQLASEGGNPLTVETTTNNRLALINGSITVLATGADVPSLSTWALIALATALAAVALRLRF